MTSPAPTALASMVAWRRRWSSACRMAGRPPEAARSGSVRWGRAEAARFSAFPGVALPASTAQCVGSGLRDSEHWLCEQTQCTSTAPATRRCPAVATARKHQRRRPAGGASTTSASPRMQCLGPRSAPTIAWREEQGVVWRRRRAFVGPRRPQADRGPKQFGHRAQRRVDLNRSRKSGKGRRQRRPAWGRERGRANGWAHGAFAFAVVVSTIGSLRHH